MASGAAAASNICQRRNPRQRAQRITPSAPPTSPPNHTSPDPEKMFPSRSSDTSSQFWRR
jgi:hypothetical protein